jgi:hypothetical protein
MRGSRFVVVVSAAVVAAGLSTAVGLGLLSPARAAVGPLFGEALALPAQVNFVAGLDVRRVLDSPLYAKFLAEREDRDTPGPLREMQERTGVDPERDVDQIVVAGWQDEAGKSKGAVVLLGRFDVSEISSLIEAESENVTWKKVGDSTMYLINEEARQGGEKSDVPGALSFLGDSAIVVGDPGAVETTLRNFHGGSGQGLEANAALIGRVEGLRSDAAFWAVGDATALSKAPQAVPGAGGAGMKIPPLTSLSMTGDLDPAVAVELVGEAADAEAAKNLADMIRGLVAFASLQANQRPELQQLATAISITTEALLVRVNARFPYELIESLRAQAEPADAEAEIAVEAESASSEPDPR